ncbi:MAG: ribosome biogenesis GTPase Der [bacterium]
MKKRLVAIVGRPNVGKSAIFNRLVGRRLAIVHEQSGTTRDRLLAEVTWGEERFTAVDTGGIINMDGATIRATIDAGVRKHVDEALQEAAAVIFVVDVQSGVTSMDQYVASMLHTAGVTVFVAANKADKDTKDDLAMEFEVFGFPVFPVSAFHDRGFDALMSAVLPVLPQCTPESAVTPLKVAIVGRPNVGKSSYINRLLHDERVIVSDIPGTTRDSVEVPFVVGSGPQARHYLLIDTAGLKRADKRGGGLEYLSFMRTQKAIDRADVVVVVTDVSQGITAHDERIVGDAIEAGKGCIIIVNKWDLAEVSPASYTDDLRHKFRGMDFVPLIFTSAKTGHNIRKTVETIDHVGAQLRAELPTGVLNRVIMRAFAQVRPPMVAGRRLNIFYATQTGTAPIRITLFVNDPLALADAYKAYLVRNMREAFGLEGAPVVIKERGRPRQSEGPRASGAIKHGIPAVIRNARRGGRQAGRSRRNTKKGN